MTTRHVLDVIRDVNGAPVPLAMVTFRLNKSSYTGAAAYMKTPKSVTTDANGAYDVILWCEDEGAKVAHYIVTYPADSFPFDLPVGNGSPVLMSSLRSAPPGVAVANLQTYVDMALLALQINMDGGVPGSVYGGVLLTINGGTP